MHAPPPRRLELASVLAALALLACGGASQAAPAGGKVVGQAEPSPLDWLPASAFAVVHVDITRVRELALWRVPPDGDDIDELIARTRTVHIALLPPLDEPRAAGVLLGDYSQEISPLLLSEQPPTRSSLAGRELLVAGDDTWLQVPGGFLGTETRWVDGVLAESDAQGGPLSRQAWAAIPRQPYLVAARASMPETLRESMRDALGEGELAAVGAWLGPALTEIDSMHLFAEPQVDGVRVTVEWEFSSEQAAGTGMRLLHGLMALAAAQTEGAGAGRQSVMQALGELRVGVEGERLRASVDLSGERARELASLGAQELMESEEGAGEGADAPAPTYVAAPADVLAERQRAARADPRFAAAVGEVIERAGPDIELVPAPGRAGETLLVVRVERDRAGAAREALAALRATYGIRVATLRPGYLDRPTELGLFRADDELSVIELAGLRASHGEALFAALRELARTQPYSVDVVDRDYLALAFDEPPGDPERLLLLWLSVCPEGNAERLRERLSAERILDCAWH